MPDFRQMVVKEKTNCAAMRSDSHGLPMTTRSILQVCNPNPIDVIDFFNFVLVGPGDHEVILFYWVCRALFLQGMAAIDLGWIGGPSKVHLLSGHRACAQGSGVQQI